MKFKKLTNQKSSRIRTYLQTFVNKYDVIC